MQDRQLVSFTEVEGLAELGAGRTHRIKNVKVTPFSSQIMPSPPFLPAASWTSLGPGGPLQHPFRQLLGYRPCFHRQGVCSCVWCRAHGRARGSQTGLLKFSGTLLRDFAHHSMLRQVARLRQQPAMSLFEYFSFIGPTEISTAVKGSRVNIESNRHICK